MQCVLISSQSNGNYVHTLWKCAYVVTVFIDFTAHHHRVFSGGNINLPFGARILFPTGPSFETKTSTACSGQETHPIFDNLNTTTHTGKSFAHAYIEGGGEAVICSQVNNAALVRMFSHLCVLFVQQSYPRAYDRVPAPPDVVLHLRKKLAEMTSAAFDMSSDLALDTRRLSRTVAALERPL